jgi:hypothetical protein
VTRREFSFGTAAFVAAQANVDLRAAAFRADVTPALGEPLIWVDPAREVLDPLWAKGVVLEAAGRRYVLCAVDWCGLGGYVYDRFRMALAVAVRGEVRGVVVHAVHQHTAPYAEGGAYQLMAREENPPLILNDRFLEEVTRRVAEAARRTLAELRPIDGIGLGVGHPERVASARRIMVDGKLVTRFSSGAKDPALAALPEGDIDTRLRTVTLMSGGRPVVRMHHYACHPQTFCCNGQVSADFVGAAREAVEKDEGVPQIYFTGCAGDVTVGKYNDGSEDARRGLAARLEAGMRAAIGATTVAPVSRFDWSVAPLRLPVVKIDWPPSKRRASLSAQDLYRQAIRAAFAVRAHPLAAARVALGDVKFVHLPGEPMLEFQRYAPEVLVAGYGDMSPGYLCPDRAFAEGGYEPSAANAGKGTEAIVKGCVT